MPRRQKPTLFGKSVDHFVLGRMIVGSLLFDVEITSGGEFEGVDVDVSWRGLSRCVDDGVDATRQLSPPLEEAPLAQTRRTGLFVFAWGKVNDKDAMRLTHRLLVEDKRQLGKQQAFLFSAFTHCESIHLSINQSINQSMRRVQSNRGNKSKI